jgi:hypothetical protein
VIAGYDPADAITAASQGKRPDAVALKPRCEGNRVIMGLYHLPSTQPAWTRREPGGAHENPETIIRPSVAERLLPLLHLVEMLY